MATPKYSYQENPSSDLTGFKIEDGKYKDVDTNSDDFINVIGDILAIEVEKENNADSGKDRENSPTESNT